MEKKLHYILTCKFLLQANGNHSNIYTGFWKLCETTTFDEALTGSCLPGSGHLNCVVTWWTLGL